MASYLETLFSLEGKTALVTGGSKGIGHMIANSLVKAGCTVYISSRSKEACDQVAAELSEYGTCVPMPHNLSSIEGIKYLASDIEAQGRGLNILINNAGATWGAKLDEFPEKGWDSVMALNVKSPFFLVQKLLDLLESSSSTEDPARVINIGSISGITSESLSAYSYNVSKAAIHHLTKVLARDLTSRHINVNCIAPGYFPSKMTKHIVENDDLLHGLLEKVPMGRLGGADEIGSLAIYLSAKVSAFITGDVIPCDGGYLVGQ
jgi:NAD(P)-dependent dehydrogenase (short-subunit alcohol dehydrogenase family)